MSEGEQTQIGTTAISVLDLVEQLQKTKYHPTKEEAFKAVELAILYEK